MTGQLTERHALDGRTLPAVEGRLAIAVAPDCVRFVLRLAPDALDAAAGCFGSALPAKIGAVAETDGRLALCVGPDEWFLLAPEGDAEAILQGFAALPEPHSLVEVSHREVGIEVRGPAAEWALGALSPLDLARMPALSGTRTILEKTQVILVKLAPDHYRIEVWQSFAPHLWGLLALVRDEVALEAGLAT